MPCKAGQLVQAAAAHSSNSSSRCMAAACRPRGWLPADGQVGVHGAGTCCTAAVVVPQQLVFVLHWTLGAQEVRWSSHRPQQGGTLQNTGAHCRVRPQQRTAHYAAGSPAHSSKRGSNSAYGCSRLHPNRSNRPQSVTARWLLGLQLLTVLARECSSRGVLVHSSTAQQLPQPSSNGVGTCLVLPLVTFGWVGVQGLTVHQLMQG